ncbi:MAG: substrate-binding domain-containing protein [Proteobacteria bacterium]|nr:substrate-binding domain-containing protein [Pseudomonadota bacterium]
MIFSNIIYALILIFLSHVAFAIDTPLKTLSNQDKIIRLATTTSTENSGLLSYLLPIFEGESGYKVHVIAVGTGKALRMGEDGDVDVLLVHALQAEQTFVENGYGLKRYPVMHNDFVVIGDTTDPATIKNSTSIAMAFKKIQSSQSLFISRGDDSGTHKKEIKIWQSSQIEPQGKWYREIGQGMGKVIQMADELGAYTLTDRGTWLSYQDKVNLQILYQGDVSLFNPYGIIAVNPERYTDINVVGANALIRWLRSKQAQQLIVQFKKHGQTLFVPVEASSTTQ